jgi:hypothetical protein
MNEVAIESRDADDAERLRICAQALRAAKGAGLMSTGLAAVAAIGVVFAGLVGSMPAVLIVVAGASLQGT